MNALVVGDIMIDRDLRGRITKISPEAPVPVIQIESQTDHLGGAANVANNLASLGANVTLMGRIGNDPAAKTILQLCSEQGIDTSLVRKCAVPTVQKNRVYGNQRQVVRFDHEITSPLEQSEQTHFCSFLSSPSRQFDFIVVADYAKGMITPEIQKALAQKTRSGPPLFIDPSAKTPVTWQSPFAIKPNWSEACQFANIDPLTSPNPKTPTLQNRLLTRLQTLWNPQHLLVTLGPEGLLHQERDQQPTWIPSEAREVFDVSGAGDTFLALFAFASASASEFSPIEACRLANAGAGLVVSRRGTASVSTSEFETLIRQLNSKK